jgi:DDE superfamily endonuclease
VSIPFIEYCEQHHIIPLCLPPHSTHVLQPLDVGDALRKEEREAKEQQVMDEKERRAALRGLVGFAKMVWKEFRMGNDVFE